MLTLIEKNDISEQVIGHSWDVSPCYLLLVVSEAVAGAAGIVFLDWILTSKPAKSWICQRLRLKSDLKLSNVTQFLLHGLSSSKLPHIPPAAKKWVYKNIKEKCYRLVIPLLIIHERLQTEMEDINHPYHKAVSEGRQGRHTHTSSSSSTFLPPSISKNNRSVPEEHSSYFKERRDAARSLHVCCTN